MLVGLVIQYKDKRFVFSNEELLKIAYEVSQEKIDKAKNRKLQGDGTQTEPYVLNDIRDYLTAIPIVQQKHNAHSALPDYVFFNIKERLIRIALEDKYIADFGPIELEGEENRHLRTHLASAYDRYKAKAIANMKFIIAMSAARAYCEAENIGYDDLLFSGITAFFVTFIETVLTDDILVTNQWHGSVNYIRRNIDAIEGLRPSYKDLQSYFDHQSDNDYIETRDSDLDAVVIREAIAQTNDEVHEIASLICGTAILCEGGRNILSPMMLLMMLDFIQNQVTYGAGKNKIYTVYKALSSQENITSAHINAYGHKVTEIIQSDGSGNKIWGGKLPMASDGSFDQMQAESSPLSKPLNTVRQKEGSILIRWLGLQTKNHLDKWSGAISNDGVSVIKSTEQNKGNYLRVPEIKIAQKGKKQTYEDISGDKDRDRLKEYFREQISNRMESSEAKKIHKKSLRGFNF